MGRKRATVIIDRKQFDEYALDKITSKVREVSVYQGVIDGEYEFAFVQASRHVRRQPREINLWEHTIRGVRTDDIRSPIIFDTPQNAKWCSQCGDWVSKNGFSPKKDSRDGLHPVCKTCRAEHERRRYWAAKLAA